MPTDFESIWSPAKVFNASTSRTASQTINDWSYIDDFLALRFSPAPVPRFERNPETLKALLALAAANEAADEEKLLSRRVKKKALAELQERGKGVEAAGKAKRGEPLLEVVEEHLTEEGRGCLNSVALLSVAMSSSSTDPQRLATHLIDLTKQEFLVEQQTQRIGALHRRLQVELDELKETLRRLEKGEENKVPRELNTEVLDWTRKNNVLRGKAEEYSARLKGMEAEYKASRVAEGLTVPTLIEREQEILALKEQVLDLEAQARGYQGLPPEKDLARLEVERVEAELGELEAKREKLYDGMIGS